MHYFHIPDDVKTCELTNSIVWFGEDGILYSRYKDAPYVTASRSQMEQEMKKFSGFIGNKKVFMIAESHPNAESPDRKDRDYISDCLSQVTAAMAILTPSALSRMVVNLFFLFKPASFPTKMFQSVSEAKQWLQGVKKGPSIPVI